MDHHKYAEVIAECVDQPVISRACVFVCPIIREKLLNTQHRATCYIHATSPVFCKINIFLEYQEIL